MGTVSRSHIGHASVATIRRLAPILVGLGEFVDGYDLLVMGAALLYLGPAFHLTPGITGALGAAAFLGAAVGLLIFGDLSDRFGRRTIFMFNLLFFVVFSILSAFIRNIPELLIARFLVGVGVGMDIPTSTAFLAEVAPAARRGRIAGTLPNVTWLLGAITSGILALVIAPFAASDTWRWLFGLAAVPALIVLLGRQILPESPRWLRSHGREREANEVFARLGLSVPAAPITPERRHYLEIFATPYRWRTIVMSLVFGFNCFAGAVGTIAAPYVLRYTGFTTKQSLQFSLAGYLVSLVGVLIGFAIIDRVSRRGLGVATTGAAFLAGLGMAWLGASSPAAMVFFYLSYQLVVWIGPAVLVWIWSTEIFPTGIRATGAGFTQAACRVAIAINISVIPLGLKMFGLRALTVFALAYLVVSLLVLGFRFFDTTGTELERVAAGSLA